MVTEFIQGVARVLCDSRASSTW